MEETKLNLNAPLLSVRRYEASLGRGMNAENSQMSQSLCFEQLTKPVAVPFRWEKIPGTAKDGSGPEPQVIGKNPAGREREKRNIQGGQKLCKRATDAISVYNRLDATETTNDEVNHEDDLNSGSDEDDEDDYYTDALETLSPTDSFSVNFGVSCHSGSDGSAAKSFGSTASDPWARNFMMSRFLASAKAMAQEPHFASRKQPLAVVEQPMRIIKAAPSGKANPVIAHTANHHWPDVEDESEVESDEDDGSENTTIKGCGLFSQLRFKNNLCLLNPIPGVKSKNGISSHHVAKQSKTASKRSQGAIVEWDWKGDVQKPKEYTAILSSKQSEVKNSPSSGLKRFDYPGNRQMMNRASSPLKRSAGRSPLRYSGLMMPNSNELPGHPFHARGLLGKSKEVDQNLKTKLNFYVKSNVKQRSWSMNPTMEKTLYVDIVNKSTMPNSEFIKDEKSIQSKRSGLKVQVEGNETESTANRESSLLNVAEGERKLAQEVKQSSSDSRGREDIEHKALVHADYPIEKAKTILMRHALAPCLPKSPSESWLCRTLPSVSSPSYRGTGFQTKRQDLRKPCSNSKWETIVKSSYTHQDHVRSSKELIPHSSQQSRVS